MGLKAIIVEDAMPMTIVLEHTLKEMGIEVLYSAKTGQDAFDNIVNLKPDFITIDTVLPDMTGIDLLNKLNDSNSEVKSIFISAAGSNNLIEEALSLGANGYILKPFDAEKLKTELDKLF